MTDNQQPRLEEQVISTAVEMGLSSQLDKVEDIHVDVHTNLIDVVQGHANSVSITAQGMVVKKDIRIKEMEMLTNSIDINPLSAIFGELKLEQPTDALVRVVLTEKDINLALNSNYVRSQIKPFELNVNERTVTFKLREMEVRIADNDRIEISGNTKLEDRNESNLLGFRASIYPAGVSHPILLESFQCAPGQTIPLDITCALINKFQELVSSPYLEFDGTAFKINQLEVKDGELCVYLQLYVKNIPSL
ncbi:MAG TPA: DUF2993 domain-containing protein [Leptolyngbyaceae cyanobacterium]